MSEWSEKKLGDIAETTSGGTPDRKNQAFFGGSIPWVKSGELEDTFINDTKEKITPEGLKHSAAKLFPSGTLLMAMYGATVGKTALLKIEAATNQAVCAIFPRAGEAGTDFLRYALVYQRPEILKLRYGGAQPNISQQVVRNLVVPLPPLPEQRKIAAVLGLVQRAIEEQERLITLTTELKKALLHKLFTEGLRGEPQKETEIGPVPENWNVVQLGACCDVVSGSLSYTDFLKMASADANDTIPCMGVKVSDMNLPGNESRFVTANLTKRLSAELARQKLVPPNTVVFPKRGAAIATNKKRLTTTWTVLDPNLIGLCAKDSLDGEFLFHWSQTFDLRKITDPGPTPQLNKKDLVPVLIPLPKEIDEQREIAAAISCIDNKMTCHQRTHATLTDLFRTLLHQLMTAQIRVHDIDVPTEAPSF